MTKSADMYLLCDPWRIIEEGWSKERNLVSESVFSLGNEYMGVRGYAEEGFSQTQAAGQPPASGGSVESLRGSYFNGIYEEVDLEKSYKGIVTKTHFMVTAVDWLSTEIRCGGEVLDMALCKIGSFRRVLDMRDGTLRRAFDWHTKSGPTIHLEFTRFLGMETECRPIKTGLGFQKISFAVSGGDAEITVVIANSFNTGHGWDKRNYWEQEKLEWIDNAAAIQARTKRTGQQVFSGFAWRAGDGARWTKKAGEKSAGFEIVVPLKAGGKGWIEKSVFNYAAKERGGAAEPVWKHGMAALAAGLPTFDSALERQQKYWQAFWEKADIRIEGDPLNQQGIRFCIFQMYQTYHGYDPSNNIGAKGLTGEGYNGHTFWDTETYCLPFYLFSNPMAARNLLEYRYTTLEAAKERAVQLDCRGACYPVATLNGEEGCNLWQHASLQFQPSTGVAFGIAHYVMVTGDTEFLYGHGVEMLVEISRFLESRGSWNTAGTGFGFYAVMGPDEFHMMVNHNCYTNYMAKKTFEFTEKTLTELEKTMPEKYSALCEKTGLSGAERKGFASCAEKMIVLYDEGTKLFEQHEGYFSLPHIDIAKIPVTDFPLYHNWSYDRIYRTDMIKQPDVLMFLFLYNQEFTLDAKRKNYEFYEPRTIHESSLSPSIHSIFASELGKPDDAFRFFGFATRMDLDNYNRNTSEGLHTTSIAAAWMNIVYGFGGLRSDGDELVLNPGLPEQWTEYEFRLLYRGAVVRVTVSAGEVALAFAQTPTGDRPGVEIPIKIYGKPYRLDASGLKLPLERHGENHVQPK
ncbi:MAG: family 65 glycosyl hydrolase [Treponema sp.]|nr:family 65 glycosyl hydrolase [Treponema sp.]